MKNKLIQRRIEDCNFGQQWKPFTLKLAKPDEGKKSYMVQVSLRKKVFKTRRVISTCRFWFEKKEKTKLGKRVGK